MSPLHLKLQIAVEALHKIANLNVRSCEAYVAKADALTLDALMAIDGVHDAIACGAEAPMPPEDHPLIACLPKSPARRSLGRNRGRG